MIFPRNMANLPHDIRRNFEFSSSLIQPISGITVVIPVRGIERQNNLNYSVSRLLLQNVEPLEILISEEDEFEKVNIDRFRSDSRIRKIFTKSNKKPFNKSIAINSGVISSKYNKILMNDADIVPPKGYLSRIDKILNYYDSCFLGKEIYNVDLLRNGLIWKGSKRTDYFSGGSIAFTKKAFFDIGGMCEEFYGYGSEDCEFWGRLKECTNINESRDTVLLHINHKRNDFFSVNSELYERIISDSMEDRISKLKENLNKRM